MVNNITGKGAPLPTDQTALRSTEAKAETNAKAAAQQTTSATQPGSTAKAAVDSVSLSSNAQALKALEEKIQKLPDVNEKRVAQIKAALASGQYSVDDLVVADKLLNLDGLFQ
jgi:negative regulator of flagellin synthesis FlgM